MASVAGIASGAALVVSAQAAAASPAPAAMTASTGSATDVAPVMQTLTQPRTVTFPKGAQHATQAAPSQQAARNAIARLTHQSRSPRPGPNSALAAPANTPIPVVPPTAVTPGHPGLQKSINGLSEYDNQVAAGFNVEPPDQGLCVGGNYVLETINSTVQVFKTSGAAASGPIFINTFFGFNSTPFLTDPSCLFDRTTGRFFVAELRLDVNPNTGGLTGKNFIDVAVSTSSNPLGSYRVYSIPAIDNGTMGTPRHPGCPCLGDYPHIAVDAHGFYVTTNEYPFSSAPGRYGNNFNGAQVYAVSKTKLASGNLPIPLVHFDTYLRTSQGRLPGFTLWPASNPDKLYATSNGGTEYFLSSQAAEEARPGNFTGYANQIASWQLTNTRSLNASRPQVRLQGALMPSESYGQPPVANQKPGPVPLRDCLVVECVKGYGPSPNEVEGGLDPSDTRMLTAWYVGGKLYGALDSVMRVSGNLQAGVAWFAVDPGSAPSNARVAGQGYLGVARANVIYPSIATRANGSGVMALTLSGNNYYPSAAYARFGRSGPTTLAVAAAGAAPEDGFCEYLFFNCGGTDSAPRIRPRWGDYGAATISNDKLWIASEYIPDRCSFATFQHDFTCGGTRTFFGNFGTRISQVNP